MKQGIDGSPTPPISPLTHACGASFFIRASLLGACLLCTARASTWYVDSLAAGAANGTTRADAWTAFAAINQSELSAGDTVEVFPGTYDERFRVLKGGSLGSRITYTAGTVGSRPVLRGITSANVNYVAILNFEITQPSTANSYDAIDLGGDTGWLIEDNYIHDTFFGGVGCTNGTVNSNNIIRHNTFSNIGGTDGGSAGGGSATVIIVIGNANLIEYNSVAESMDRTHVFGTGNVIRNNFWGYTDTTLYPNTSPYPNHNDGCQSYQGGLPLIQLLYERNYDTDNTDSVGGTNAHGFLVQDQVGTSGFDWYILRFNMLIRVGGGAYSVQNVTHTYVYNSTYIEIQHGSLTKYNTAAGYTYPSTYSTASSNSADVRNNTWDYCPNCLDPHGIISSAYLPTNFTSAAQHGFNSGGTQVVLLAGASPANLAQTDPLFTDPTQGIDDYTLQTGSPLVDAGAPITSAIGAGSSSNSLTVADSKRLFDGWGIADGDIIRVGSGPLVQISSINYQTNVVTLASAASWNNGDPVFVKGSEDVGALPSLYATSLAVTNTTPSSLPAGAATLSASVNNPDAVRKVEFLVDGIPVGESYNAPYSVGWTADGSSHSIEARAYNAWASKTLSVSSFLSISGATSSPAFITQPLSQTPKPGATVVLSASATSSSVAAYTPTYQWQLNGNNLSNGGIVSGSNTETLTLTGISAANNGSYTVTASDPTGNSTISSAATILVTAAPVTVATSGSNTSNVSSTNLDPPPPATVQTQPPTSQLSPVSPPARLSNLSARASAGSGTNSLIAGFVISGGSKTVLLRGIGPTLTHFAVSNALPDPELFLDYGPTTIQTNCAWGGGPTLTSAFSQVGAFALQASSKDDAILSTLEGGAYTAQITSPSGSTGIVLAEIYDADPSNPGSTSRLIDVSARANVGVGDNILIAGFVVSGGGTEKVLIRAIGPTLASFGLSGTLATPQLTLTRSDGTIIASNAVWGGTAVLSKAFAQVGAFTLPPTSNDSAILATLPPGSYTAQVSGSSGDTGVALVEIYEIP